MALVVVDRRPSVAGAVGDPQLPRAQPLLKHDVALLFPELACEEEVHIPEDVRHRRRAGADAFFIRRTTAAACVCVWGSEGPLMRVVKLC